MISTPRPTNPRQVRALVVHDPNLPLINPSDHPDRESWEAVGQRYQEHFLGAGAGDWRHPWDVEARKGSRQHHAPQESVPQYSVPRQPSPVKAAATCKVQVVRSVCDWSHGVLTEHSIQDACESFPRRQYAHAQCLTALRSPNDHGGRAFHLYWCVIFPIFPPVLLTRLTENQFLYVLMVSDRLHT